MDTKLLAKRALSRDLTDPSALEDLFEVARLLEGEDFEAAHKLGLEVRHVASREAVKTQSEEMYRLYRKSLLFDAPYNFDAHCQYIEMNRDPDKKFYLPRRRQLKRVADELQMLADDKLDLLAISLPPGVGKTTLALFFITWLAGRNPEKPILTGSHSNAFLRGAYEECLRIMRPDGDYLWNEVFPEVQVIRTNAQDMMADLGRGDGDGKRFATLEFSSVGSGNAGKVRAENLLYCDDLVSDIQQALSRDRMDTLWMQYTTDLRQRKIGGCKELHIATRWSCSDVIGRLEQNYTDSDRAHFLVVPALDENDESNFDYGNHAGFTTEFYRKQRDIMDEASWRALYQNQPIEREGLLYPESELRRFFELPDGEPDAILAVCDTKDRGVDYCFLPVAYQYGNDFYIVDAVCDNGAPDVVESRVISALVKHNPHAARFESNAAGGKVAQIVQAEIKKRGARTKITTKYTTQNKETKIIINAPWLKEHCLFLDNSRIGENRDYKRMMQFLCSYTMAGKNKHDDVPDGLAMLAQFVQGMEVQSVQVARRIF